MGLPIIGIDVFHLLVRLTSTGFFRQALEALRECPASLGSPSAFLQTLPRNAWPLRPPLGILKGVLTGVLKYVYIYIYIYIWQRVINCM